MPITITQKQARTLLAAARAALVTRSRYSSQPWPDLGETIVALEMAVRDSIDEAAHADRLRAFWAENPTLLYGELEQAYAERGT